MNIKKILRNSGVAVAAAVVSASSFAAAPADIAGLASSVSFSDVALAVLAVAATLIALHVTIRGAKQVMAFVGK